MSLLWFNANYPYRRQIQVTAPLSDAPLSHPVTYTFPVNPLPYRKVRPDFQDVNINYKGTQIPAYVALNSNSNLQVIFPLQATIPALTVDSYYVYYGNLNLLTEATPISYFPPEWPVVVRANGIDPGIAFTRPGEYWINGASSIPLAKATFAFFGSKISAVAFKGPNQGIVEIQMDNGFWNVIDLFSPRVKEFEVVFNQDNLDQKQHIIRYRVSGRKNPGSAGAEINLIQFQYYKHVNGVDMGEEVNPALIWASHGMASS